MYFVMHTVAQFGIIKGRKKMMTDEQIEILIAEMKDAMYDAQEEFGVTKIEIYPNSTCSSTRRHKRRSNENRRS